LDSASGYPEDSYAIIDVGSNTVRLVIFLGAIPHQQCWVNIKTRCRLAEGIEETGKLSPEGRRKALKAVGEYLQKAETLTRGEIQVVATSAVRDAANGRKFVRKIEKSFGHRVAVLSGEQEALLCATGVLTGYPRASGLIVDVGGGSLEIAEAAEGELFRTASLPIGHVRLLERSRNDPDRFKKIIDEELDCVDWLAAGYKETLYLTGGAFRSLARAYMKGFGETAKIQGYTVPCAEMKKFIKEVCKGKFSKKADDISLLIAARLAAGLIKRARPSFLTFSTRGLRDGCYATRFTVENPETRLQPPQPVKVA